MILVFDLDDTLFDDMQFVRGGLHEVSRYLHKTYSIPTNVSFPLFIRQAGKNRSRVFDNVLSMLGLHTKREIKKCIGIYRSHKPRLSLHGDALRCFKRLRAFPLYIVTDGHKTVQAAKIKALGLDKHVKFSFITHRYGVRHAKPSPWCFLKICKIEKVHPGEVVYVADNPEKDFVGIKPLGFVTVRILRGRCRHIVKTRRHEAAFRIDSLDELTLEFLDKIIRTD
ncbi:MAG: hypothetical protein A2583_14315 [Bdellovibrionales bacterium RIFOXYD1_FULL_53_11]|nr:MAG: hypothetical protein A2583_14315 [Bdellovibrionales bacterium RIFOXYD1_FULL_53_11]